MVRLLSILLSDIAPIFAIAAIGFFMERRAKGSAAALSKIAFNVLSPCLIFDQLVRSSITGKDAARMALYCVLLIIVMGAAARLAAIPLGIKGTTLSSFLLVIMFSNSGNYALPVILFAFGREALAHASINFVTSAVVVYTAGVFIAARNGRTWKETLHRMLRVPALHALIAAGLVIVTHVQPPVWVLRPISMLNDAALPMMVLVLGMQLQRVEIPRNPSVVGTAVGLSLIMGPAVGFALTALLGISGPAREAALVLAAMPSAVITTVLAMEFELDSNFVTSVVFASTLLSPLTLAALIAYLKS